MTKHLDKHNKYRKKCGLPPLPYKTDKEYFESLKDVPSLVELKGLDTDN